MKTYACVLTAIVAISLVEAAFTTSEPTDKATLSKQLFFDPILSQNRTISCASCHREEFTFADTSMVSVGVFGRKGKRNTPSSMNLLLQASFFWDGRSATLEEQALIPIANPDEMDLPIDVAVNRLNKSKTYRAYFKQVFGEAPTKLNLAKALAAFQQTLPNIRPNCFRLFYLFSAVSDGFTMRPSSGFHLSYSM